METRRRAFGDSLCELHNLHFNSAAADTSRENPVSAHEHVGSRMSWGRASRFDDRHQGHILVHLHKSGRRAQDLHLAMSLADVLALSHAPQIWVGPRSHRTRIGRSSGRCKPNQLVGLVLFRAMVDASQLRIVSSNNVEILRHMSQAQLRRSGIVHTVGSSVAELRMLIARESPAIVIIEAKLADGSGLELCREIKKGRSTQVIVAYDGVPSAQDVARIASSGCNDIMVLPLHSDDFYCHISQVTSMAWRASLRVGVNLKVKLERGDQVLHGAVVNVALRGIGLRVDSELALGPLLVTIEHSEDNFHGIAAEVVWCKPSEAGGFAVGIRLLEVPALARSLLTRLSLFQVSENETGNGITIAMQGAFDEKTDFQPLLAQVQGQGFVDFAMQGITYISSVGVSAWSLFLNEVRPDLGYSFRNCSVAFASQASMVPMAIGRGTVLSVQAPYVCEPCRREETRLVECALVRGDDGPITAPTLHCHVCDHVLTFDDLPERYFAFLTD